MDESTRAESRSPEPSGVATARGKLWKKVVGGAGAVIVALVVFLVQDAIVARRTGSLLVRVDHLPGDGTITLDTGQTRTLKPSLAETLFDEVTSGDRRVSLSVLGHSQTRSVHVTGAQEAQVEFAVPRVGSVEVSLSALPVAANLRLGGSFQVLEPGTIAAVFKDVPVGLTEVTAEAAGFHPQSATVSVSPGTKAILELARLEPLPVKAKVKRVRFQLNRFKVYKDGDGLTDFDGDLVWSFEVNGKLLVENTKAVGHNDGDVREFFKNVEIELEEGDELVFIGHVTDEDGGTSGADDKNRFSLKIPYADVATTPERGLRPARGGDFDVEVFYEIELR